MKNECKKETQQIEEYLSKTCDEKFNQFKSCGEESNCPCSEGTSSGGKVDFVLLIDSSGSMSSKAKAINDAAIEAFEQAKKECGADVRDTWLWVDRAKPSSSSSHSLGADAGNYTQSHQQYLEGIGATGPFYHDMPDNPATGGSYPPEQGADAVADISKFFDWREGACRSIFYVSDTTLEGGNPGSSDATANDLAKNNAISVANANSVTVFAHRAANYVPTGGMSASDCDQDYQELCTGTGGFAETGSSPTIELYKNLISRAICECGGGCLEVEAPEIKPCISISWGDSKCDSLETDDFEILCISICNCYSNVTFNDLNINLIEITDSDGNTIANLPDGTPSVQAVPKGPLCFGTIAPCKDGETSCVSREFVINTRGAKEGNYLVKLHGICFEVSFSYNNTACFEFELCKS